MFLSGSLIVMKAQTNLLNSYKYGTPSNQNTIDSNEKLEIFDSTTSILSEDKENIWLLTFLIPIAFAGLCYFVISYFL